MSIIIYDNVYDRHPQDALKQDSHFFLYFSILLIFIIFDEYYDC